MLAIIVAGTLISWTNANKIGVFFGDDETIYMVYGDEDLENYLSSIGQNYKKGQFEYVQDNVSIKGVSEKIHIRIQHGVLSDTKHDADGPGVSWQFMPFKSLGDQDNLLSKSEKGSSKGLWITVNKAGGKDKISMEDIDALRIFLEENSK